MKVILNQWSDADGNLSTSNVLEHSLSGTITTAQGIIIAVGKPLMAKLADVYVYNLCSNSSRADATISVGRGETFIIVTLLYVIGYVSTVPCDPTSLS